MNAEHLQSPRFTPSPQLMNNLRLLSILGAVVTIIGIIFVPEREWASMLLAGIFLLGLGIAGVVFIAIQYVTNAGWSTVIRRIPESMLSSLVAGALIILIAMAGIHHLYPWSDSSLMGSNPILKAKEGWLNVPFFIGRTVAYIVIWLLLSTLIIKNSIRHGEEGELRYRAKSKTASAIFLVVFALTFSLASMDWIMSLEPHWYSTIFGVYNIIGAFVSGLTSITLIALILKRKGYLTEYLTGEHFHNLGKLIFAFSTFWMYIWFSQYLLIWYSNIPEEVTYMVKRQHGSWLIFTIVNVLFNWVIPFFALLPSWTKKHEGLLLRVCIILLLGRWIDLFWMILPPFLPDAPVVNIWELAPMFCVIPGFFYLMFKSLAKRSIIPAKDTMLVESLPLYHFHG
ncbi:MAG: hypothetical protein EPO24_01770 [Bacteroidetes bacterium]|nr:MAG: hypothetical protein EPO24_01770 [Bacteroidota bacterium]